MSSCLNVTGVLTWGRQHDNLSKQVDLVIWHRDFTYYKMHRAQIVFLKRLLNSLVDHRFPDFVCSL